MILDCEIMLNIMTTLNTRSFTVDKSSKGPKAAGATAGRTQQHSSASQVGPTEEEEEKDIRLQKEKKSQCVLHLRKLIVNGNRRLEALALVVQHIFSEVGELYCLIIFVLLSSRCFFVRFTPHSFSICLSCNGFNILKFSTLLIFRQSGLWQRAEQNGVLYMTV